MLHIFWETRSNYSKLQKANRATCESERFSSHHYVNASSVTSELPFTSLNSAPPSTWYYLGTGITTPPLRRCFLLLIRSRHGRSAEILISAFQKTPDKDTWSWRRNAGTPSVGMTISSFVTIFSREAGLQIRKRIVWKHAGNHLVSQPACLHTR